jgi:hypothetical protein
LATGLEKNNKWLFCRYQNNNVPQQYLNHVWCWFSLPQAFRLGFGLVFIAAMSRSLLFHSVWCSVVHYSLSKDVEPYKSTWCQYSLVKPLQYTRKLCHDFGWRDGVVGWSELGLESLL